MKKKILVIDDDEQIRALMHEVLTSTGYEVILSPDGVDAIEKLSAVNVDLVILDMNMPKMNGISFLKYTKEKKLTRAPILMVTGMSDPEQRAESYRLGVYDYISKPEDIQVMLKRIENGLKIGEILHYNEQVRSDLMVAQRLQSYLFPEPQLTSEYLDIRAWTRPLSDIGGDLYDYVEFRDGRIILIVADVSGHSISAAMYTAIVKMVFMNAIRETDDPGQVLMIMNRKLSGHIPMESYVTMFCCLIDPGKSSLSYANAGHPYPFILSDGEVSRLAGHGSLMGPMPEAEYSTETMDISRVESIFIFTDGVSDLRDGSGETVGMDYLVNILENGSSSVETRFNRIRGYLMSQNYTRMDDCTLVAIELRK